MAQPGDILAPKLLQDGTFEETVLTPALIGAASSATVATLGEGFSTLYNTVSELGVESITGLPEALAAKADLVGGTVPISQLPVLDAGVY